VKEKNLMENRPLTQVHAEKGREEGGQYNKPGARFTDIVLRFILRHVIRSSYDKS